MTADAAEQLINPSGIARLAGVAPSTVSNWRIRDEDFPRPENEDAARPLFSVAKVTAWLKSKNIEAAPRPQASILTDTIRGTVPADKYIEVLVPLLCAEHWARSTGQSLIEMTFTKNPAGHASGGMFNAFPVVATAARETAQSHRFVSSAINRSLELVGPAWGPSTKLEDVCAVFSAIADLSAIADDLIEAAARNAKSPLNAHSAPRAFARFLDGVLPPGGTTFADLACGFGRTLLTAAETRATQLVGNDVNDAALEIAACQLFLRDRSANLEVADLLQSAPRFRYDRIILHPPFGLRISDAHMGRPWPFGAPPKGQGDLLWPQAAFQELTDGGYAAVVLPTAALSRSGKARDVWARMIAKGAIEAIISLPGNSQLNTALPVSVLILCANPSPRGVLMMHLPDTGAFSTKRTNTSDEKQWDAYEAALQILSVWRGGGTGTTDSSIEVPREKLLAPDAVATPQSWLATLAGLSEDRVEQTAKKVQQAAVAWEETVRGWELPPSAETATPHTEAAPLRPISELAYCVPRGTYSKLKESASDAVAPPAKVYTLTSLRSGRPELLPRHAARDAKRVTTEPGDILVANVGRSIITLVCEEDGLEVDRNLGLVRPPKDEWDADFLAQQLMADHNQAMLSGTTVQRVDIRHLLVPTLPLQEQKAAGELIRQFTHFTQRAKAATEQAEQYVSAMREALASGSFTITEKR